MRVRVKGHMRMGRRVKGYTRVVKASRKRSARRRRSKR